MKKQNKKKTIITVTAVVLVVVIGLGVWFGVSRGRSEPVKVFAFNYVGMTEYWGDSQESYGPVSTDKIQTVFLSSTQTVTEMKVAQGDMVKKGDVLMTFDTTLSDLQLERKRLEVEKLKLDLETAQKKLKDIRNMKPMSIVTPDDSDDSEDDDSGKGVKLSGSYQLSTNSDYDGSMAEKALICWLNTAAAVDNGLLEAARQKAEEYQNKITYPTPRRNLPWKQRKKRRRLRQKLRKVRQRSRRKLRIRRRIPGKVLPAGIPGKVLPAGIPGARTAKIPAPRRRKTPMKSLRLP